MAAAPDRWTVRSFADLVLPALGARLRTIADEVREADDVDLAAQLDAIAETLTTCRSVAEEDYERVLLGLYRFARDFNERPYESEPELAEYVKGLCGSTLTKNGVELGTGAAVHMEWEQRVDEGDDK